MLILFKCCAGDACQIYASGEIHMAWLHCSEWSATHIHAVLTACITCKHAGVVLALGRSLRDCMTASCIRPGRLLQLQGSVKVEVELAGTHLEKHSLLLQVLFNYRRKSTKGWNITQVGTPK